MTNLYTDLETIPDQNPNAMERILDTIKPPGTLKKQESIDKWFVEKAPAAAAEQFEKSGLNGLHGEICSISWALDDGAIDGQVRMPNDSEADLINSFFDAVGSEASRGGQGDHPRLTWIGHNIIDFDLRFLKQRCIVNDIRPPFLIPADARHGSASVFDTMKAWTGWKGYVSQDALCEALGLPQKAGMTGADVWPAYQAGKFGDILAYNRDDVATVRELHRRMAWG